MKNTLPWKCAIACLVVVPLLAACGGGGGGGGGGEVTSSEAASTGFPFASAVSKWHSSARTTEYAVTGSCTGTATEVSSAAAASTFDGAPAMKKTVSVTVNAGPCSGSDSTQEFFTPDFVPLGDISPGGYIRYSLTLPKSLVAGASGELGTSRKYADATSTTVITSAKFSYRAEADATPGALLVKITIVDSTGNNTQVDTYRLTSDGTLNLLSREFASVGSFRLTLAVK